MRVSAYVLIADPSFLRESLSAYYDRVDRIVLSFDATHTSWTGTALPVAECLAIVDALDIDKKCVQTPGHFARLDQHPLDNDTYQRQHALDAASEGADWVLQLDTDEVMADPATFFSAMNRAAVTGMTGLEYPSRWLYAQTGPQQYLEASTRLWRHKASYPGPLAVAAGTPLVHARQADALLYRVDLRPWNTDPAHAHDARVHQVVPAQSAVVHYSWVRDHDTMKRKFGWSGHTQYYSEPKVYRRWAARQQHPWRTVLASPFRRNRDDAYRLSTVRPPVGGVR